MSVFNIDDDIKKFLARAQLTLDEVDDVARDAKLVMKRADEALTRINALLEAFSIAASTKVIM